MGPVLGPRRRSGLTTVDSEAVNDPELRPWLNFGSNVSPRQMVAELGCGELVEFVHQPSVPFLDGCDEQFDLIFLDGSHTGDDVYQEVPRALKLLRSSGVILLHDYFPDLRPLWSDGSMIAGPVLAIERLQREGAPLTVLPCGQLPWPTKLGSSVTSLAVLARRAS